MLLSLGFAIFLAVAVSTGAAVELLYAAAIPDSIKSLVLAGNGVLPATFEIFGLQGYSTDHGHSVKYLSFFYLDTATQVATWCQSSNSSVPEAVPNPATRWPCDDKSVYFILLNNDLTMIEKVVFPLSSAAANFEVSGSIGPLSFTCDLTSYVAPYGIPCSFNVTDCRGTFSSLEPILSGVAKGT